MPINHFPRSLWLAAFAALWACAAAADDGCGDCGAPDYPEAQQLVQAHGFPQEAYEVLVAWREAAPAEPGTFVQGVHMRPRSGGTPFDLYFTDDAQLLSDAERDSLGIVPKDWSARPQTAEAEIHAGPDAPPPPMPVLAARSKSLRKVAVPPVDLQRVRDEDARGIPGLAKGVRRIGVVVDLPEPVRITGTEASAGAWQSLADGSRVWSAVFEAPGAVGQRLHLTRGLLPSSAQVLAYNADDPTERYAVTPIDGGDAWSPTCFSERVAVECAVPPEAVGQPVELAVAQTVYVYAGPGEWNWEKVGNCHTDVTCRPEWADLAAGVAGIGSVGSAGFLWCTGSLVADSDPQTSIPYFLTANHCVENQSEASSLEVYWMYQTTECNGTPPNPRNVPRTTGGADYLAGSTFSSGNDFALLRLRGAVPGGVTFLGWDSFATPTGRPALGIHHPDGSFKRISFGGIDQSVPLLFGISADRYYGVYWSEGVTEPGSSGSPLIDATTRHIIGQLYGGTSACNKPDGPDVYGRFDKTYPVVRDYLGPRLRVERPNGGEFFRQGTTQTIEWTSAGEGGTVRIQLLKRGGPFADIASDAPNSGSYHWPVPDKLPEAADYRIRITSNADATLTDDSDGDFSIASELRVTVLTPNGGENWPLGSRQSIAWTAPGVPGNVGIELLRNDAATLTIVESTANDGIHTWTLPESLTPGDGYAVRITALQLPDVSDVSDGTFRTTVEPSITVLTPDGGETWPQGRTRTITWTSRHLEGVPVTIQLLRGTPDSQPVLTIASSTPNDGSEDWAIPDDLPEASDYFVRIASTDPGAHADTSDGPFWIGDCAPPPATGITASDGTNSQYVFVQWNPSPLATQYRVFRSTSPDVEAAAPISDWQYQNSYRDYTATLGASVGSGGCADAGPSGTVYYYWVQSRNTCDEGPVSGPDIGYRGANGGRSLESRRPAAAGDLLVAALAMAILCAAGRGRKTTTPPSEQ